MRSWILPLLGAVLAFSTSVHAETHALLVGVNSLTHLPPRLHLRGAVNDVALMRETLLAQGVTAPHITVLARGLPQTQGAPTLASIQQALQRLRDQAQRGDTVLLHLAGHGAQVPQSARSSGAPEADGLDEVFLAEDVQPWDATTQRLPGALLDDEIGAWMDALVDRGVQVLAVIDSCHAAGLLRQGAQSGARSLVAAELGIPPTPRASQRPLQAQRLDGRIVALAARANEVTGEEWLPKGAGLASTRRHGIFSHAVAEALRAGTHDAASLRAALMQRYATEGRTSPTPVVMGAGRWGR